MEALADGAHHVRAAGRPAVLEAHVAEVRADVEELAEEALAIDVHRVSASSPATRASACSFCAWA